MTSKSVLPVFYFSTNELRKKILKSRWETNHILCSTLNAEKKMASTKPNLFTQNYRYSLGNFFEYFKV